MIFRYYLSIVLRVCRVLWPAVLLAVGGYAFGCSCFAAGESSWILWVIDDNTRIGIPGASIDMWPEGKPEQAEHYRTGRAGRVMVRRIPARPDFRVTINGRELPIPSSSLEIATENLGLLSRAERTRLSKTRSMNVSQAIVYVEDKKADNADDAWNSNTPTRYTAYVQDQNARELIPGVFVRAVRSGATAQTDADGHFTIEIPASYRRRSPSISTETLVFSKPGYKTFEYRQLVLWPGLNEVQAVLQKGTGSMVGVNRTGQRGSFGGDFFEFKGSPRRLPEGYTGEIISFEIIPSTYIDGWTFFKSGATAVVHARNVTSLEIRWFPTGTEITSSSSLGMMKKVKTSTDDDTWELELPRELITTSFWAEGRDENGKTVRSIDIGNVGFDDGR